MTNEETVRLLMAAKERLFTHGWRKGDYGKEEGPNCIVGALYAEQKALGLDRRTAIDARFRLDCLVPEMPGVANFNDNVNTSFDDIVDLLDKTIKSLEGGK